MTINTYKTIFHYLFKNMNEQFYYFGLFLSVVHIYNKKPGHFLKNNPELN